MSITFPINPLHGQQYAPSGIPITWQFDSGRNAWRVMRVGPAWFDIVGKPTEFPPADHDHPIDEVVGLQGILDGKQDLSSKAYPNGYASLDQDGRVPIGQLPFGTFTGDWDDITSKPSEFPPSPHTHPVAQISDSSSTGQQIVRAPTGADVLNIIGGINQDGNARVQVEKNSGIIGVRRSINFKEGSNVTMSIVDDPGNEEVGVTINAGGGGGGASITVSEVKPAAPLDSSMWLDVATGILFIYYNDGSTSQWIEALPYLTAMPGVFTKFDFPAAPVNDQLYNPIPGATWKWSSTRGVWYAVSTSSGAYTKAESDSKFVDIIGDVMTGPLGLVHPPTANVHAASKQYVDERLIVSSTPPVGAADGTLWWEDDSGQLYLRYNDGNTSQWVVAVPQPDTSTFLSKAAQALTVSEQQQVRQNIYAAPFDALAYNGMQINGGMEVNQELGTGTFTGTNGAYVCDGWKFNVAVAGTAPGAMTTTSSIPGFNYLTSIVTNIAKPSLAAGDTCFLSQSIEGFRVSKLGWGVPNAAPITIGFWSIHGVPGLYTGTVRSEIVPRSYAFSYTHSVANVPQYNTITLPGDTTSSWHKLNGGSILLCFCVVDGGNLTAPALNTWTATNTVAGPGQTNAFSAIANFQITGVTVLSGLQAPTAAQSANLMRSYDQELLTCQRYLRYLGYGLIGTAETATVLHIPYSIFPYMRTVPTVTTVSNMIIRRYANSTDLAIGITSNVDLAVSTSGGRWVFNLAGSLAQLERFHTATDNVIKLNARL